MEHLNELSRDFHKKAIFRKGGEWELDRKLSGTLLLAGKGASPQNINKLVGGRVGECPGRGRRGEAQGVGGWSRIPA